MGNKRFRCCCQVGQIGYILDLWLSRSVIHECWATERFESLDNLPSTQLIHQNRIIPNTPGDFATNPYWEDPWRLANVDEGWNDNYMTQLYAQSRFNFSRYTQQTSSLFGYEESLVLNFYREGGTDPTDLVLWPAGPPYQIFHHKLKHCLALTYGAIARIDDLSEPQLGVFASIPISANSVQDARTVNQPDGYEILNEIKLIDASEYADRPEWQIIGDPRSEPGEQFEVAHLTTDIGSNGARTRIVYDKILPDQFQGNSELMAIFLDGNNLSTEEIDGVMAIDLPWNTMLNSVLDNLQTIKDDGRFRFGLLIEPTWRQSDLFQEFDFSRYNNNGTIQRYTQQRRDLKTFLNADNPNNRLWTSLEYDVT